MAARCADAQPQLSTTFRPRDGVIHMPSAPRPRSPGPLLGADRAGLQPDEGVDHLWTRKRQAGGQVAIGAHQETV
jgi:hypothetical protein